MTFQLLGLAVNIFISPLAPPILVPLSYSRTTILLLQEIDPFILSVVSLSASTLSTVSIRFIQNHIISKLVTYEKRNKKDFLSRIIININKYMKKQTRITKIGGKREQYIKTKKGKFLTFFIAILCYVPILPDIISTRILYKKIKFKYFIFAVIIGKGITHIPFIYAGKTIFQLLNIHL